MAKKKEKKSKDEYSGKYLDGKSLALTSAIVWGGAVLLIGLSGALLNYGNMIVNLIGTVYIGYNNTVTGAFIGAIYGIVDGLVCGWIFAWLYEYLLKSGSCK